MTMTCENYPDFDPNGGLKHQNDPKYGREIQKPKYCHPIGTNGDETNGTKSFGRCIYFTHECLTFIRNCEFKIRLPVMRSNKVGVARQIEKREQQNINNHGNHGKVPSGRKISTTSRITIHSNLSQPEEREAKYTRRELKEYRQLFNMFDTDGSGAIGNEELKQAMLSIGMHANAAEIDNVIKEVDADGNGEIDFDEFCACMKRSQSIVKSTNEELIRECFDVFDQDRNGFITENEFKYIAIEFGDFTEDLAEKVFRELDVSANGHLSQEQFANIVEDYLLAEPMTRQECDQLIEHEDEFTKRRERKLHIRSDTNHMLLDTKDTKDHKSDNEVGNTEPIIFV